MMLLAQTTGFTPDALAEWLKVVFFLAGGIAAVGVAIRQFSPRPPAQDLDKELTRINGVIHQLTAQHGALVEHVKDREAHAEKRRTEIYTRLGSLEEQRGCVREAVDSLKTSVREINAKVDRLLQRVP